MSTDKVVERCKPLDDQSGNLSGYIVFCPGCECGHLFHTVPWKGNAAGTPGPVWTFNGNTERPTFSPSMLVNKSTPERRCHSYVRDGQIQFLNDCYHALKGTTVELPDIGVW